MSECGGGRGSGEGSVCELERGRGRVGYYVLVREMSVAV